MCAVVFSEAVDGREARGLLPVLGLGISVWACLGRRDRSGPPTRTAAAHLDCMRTVAVQTCLIPVRSSIHAGWKLPSTSAASPAVSPREPVEARHGFSLSCTLGSH